jgi:glycosyltransferase involved in cell wall biosynthesis
MRAAVLYIDNGVDILAVEPIYLPVSSLGKCIRTKSNEIQNIFHLKQEDVIILYYGQMAKGRKSDEIIKIAKTFPINWKLVLHGIDNMHSDMVIREQGVSEQVILSTTLMPYTDLLNFVASATIGLVLYDNSNFNNMLTAFASEKLGVFLMCGIPVVALKNPGYEIIERYQCGKLIRSINEMPRAVQEILNHYEQYQNNAYCCFEEEFDYSKNFVTLKQYLSKLSG